MPALDAGVVGVGVIAGRVGVAVALDGVVGVGVAAPLVLNETSSIASVLPPWALVCERNKMLTVLPAKRLTSTDFAIQLLLS